MGLFFNLCCFFYSEGFDLNTFHEDLRGLKALKGCTQSLLFFLTAKVLG